MIHQAGLEHDIVQNDALGALAVWSFAAEFFKAKGRTQGVPVPLAMIVLPIVYHRESVDALSTRNFDGGLFSALNDNRGLFAGLQHRMRSMWRQSFAAINVALAARLLHYDPESCWLTVSRASEPKEVMTEDISRILATARRLGYWVAQTGGPQLLNILGVRL